MIFSVVSSAQEWLNVKWDEHKKQLEDKELEKVKAFEEAERVNSHFNSNSLLFRFTYSCAMNAILCRKFSRAHA